MGRLELMCSQQPHGMCPTHHLASTTRVKRVKALAREAVAREVWRLGSDRSGWGRFWFAMARVIANRSSSMLDRRRNLPKRVASATSAMFSQTIKWSGREQTARSTFSRRSPMRTGHLKPLACASSTLRNRSSMSTSSARSGRAGHRLDQMVRAHLPGGVDQHGAGAANNILGIAAVGI
jgi:hypothetical protein